MWSDKNRVRRSQNGRYEILKVIGPDEYKEGVNNNAYTNYMAHFNMELALKYLDVLSEETKQRIEKKYSTATIKEKILEVKDKLYLPVADEDGKLDAAVNGVVVFIDER